MKCKKKKMQRVLKELLLGIDMYMFRFGMFGEIVSFDFIMSLISNPGIKIDDITRLRINEHTFFIRNYCEVAGFMVGVVRFELTASCSRSMRANRAALHPEPLRTTFSQQQNRVLI